MLKSFFQDHAEEGMKNIEVDRNFKHQLKKELLNSGVKRNSILSLISNLMKRYSLASLAGFAILALVAINALPGRNNPIPSQQAIATPLEGYTKTENQGEIYHYKELEEIYDEGKVEASILSESYTDEIGNSLYIRSHPKNQDIESVQLTQVDEWGDVTTYSTHPDEGWYLNPATEEHMDILEGEKVFCFEKREFEDVNVEAKMIFPPEDTSRYGIVVSPTIKDDPAAPDYVPDAEKDSGVMTNLAVSRPSIVDTKQYITHLIQKQSYNYSQVEEGGKQYHLFKIPSQNDYSTWMVADEPFVTHKANSDAEVWFYFDSQTYELSHYENHNYDGQNGLTRRVTILSKEFVDPSQRSTIFSKDRFSPLEGFQVIVRSAEIPFKVESNGCFDYQGRPLELEELPGDIQKLWSSTLEDMTEENYRIQQ